MKFLFDRVKGDKVIWIIVILLSLFSMLAVYSSTGTLAYIYRAGNTEYYLFKHFSLLLFGLFLMYITHLVNYKFFSGMAVVLLVISAILLVFTLFKGTSINEARRWLTLPILNYTFQTSDLAKISLIMYVARFLAKTQADKQSFSKTFLPLIIPVIIICGLIAPADFSTAAILFASSLLLMFIGRVKMKYLLSFMGIAIVIFTLFVFAASHSDNTGRIYTWLNRIEQFVQNDTETYQNQQAKIAIATGGILGKGPGKSTQRNSLPHPYSDFIYAIIIEEYGLVGGIIIAALYLIFLFRCIKIVIRTPKAFGALLAVGLGFSLVIQAMINMAVTVNILPVTGLSLPLVSMGGTSLWFTSLSIGIILSVSKHIEKTGAETGS
ncbi:MAG: FtsW/RodA/SpoVE family cell cycle protein [Bacteroidetes bacterium]|nr:FtsW/RodA/SpoVE family cell cycle protein [Bacteroidota bacterium]